eukprot:COSAG02_NODE_13204_length_1426_cov_118.985682_1_plen_382_part_10
MLPDTAAVEVPQVFRKAKEPKKTPTKAKKEWAEEEDQAKQSPRKKTKVKAATTKVKGNTKVKGKGTGKTDGGADPVSPTKAKKERAEEKDQAKQSPRKKTKVKAATTKVKGRAKVKGKGTGKTDGGADPVSPPATSKRSSWKLALVGEVSILDASVWGEYAQDEETKIWADQNRGTKYEVKILAWEGKVALPGHGTSGLYTVQHEDEAPFSLPLKELLPGMSVEARAKVHQMYTDATSPESSPRVPEETLLAQDRKRQSSPSSDTSSDDSDSPAMKRHKSDASMEADEAHASNSQPCAEMTTASEAAPNPAASAVSERKEAKVTAHNPPADPFAGGGWGQMKDTAVAPSADSDAFGAGGAWGASAGPRNSSTAAPADEPKSS